MPILIYQGCFFYAILINRGIGTKNTKEGVYDYEGTFRTV